MNHPIWKPVTSLPLQGPLLLQLQSLLNLAGLKWAPDNAVKAKLTVCIDTQNDQGQITFGPNEP